MDAGPWAQIHRARLIEQIGIFAPTCQRQSHEAHQHRLRRGGYSAKDYAPTITKPREHDPDPGKDMALISGAKRPRQDEVLEESRVMLTAVFDELCQNQEGIVSRSGRAEDDKDRGHLEKCGSDLVISRAIAARASSAAPISNCRFTLPLPRSGTVK